MKSIPERNTRQKALSAALIASILFAGSADAAGTHRKLVLSGYQDGATGAKLLAGNYDAVIKELGDHGTAFDGDAVAASTNLCIAYIMTRRWSPAHAACDEAIELAKRDEPDAKVFSIEAHYEQIALAYSNRAVLDWLEDRQESATDDLAKAQSLSPGSQFVSQNLAALGTGNDVRVSAMSAGSG